MANPTQQEVAQAVYDLTSKWKPDGASAVQSWWPPVSEKPAVDVVHALRVQAERIEASGQIYYPYPVYYGGHDNSRWEWAGLTWTAPMLVDPATGQLSHAYATSVLNEDLEALKKKLWSGGVAPRPTRADVLKPMANYCNQTDSRGQVIYGPSLPAAIEKGWADEWFEKDRALGSTHWIYGPMDPGQAYPGDFPNEPINPDSRTPEKFRELALNILNRASANGRGYVPVCFLDGGGSDPKVRIDTHWKAWGEAVADIQEFMIIVPAWETVGPGGAWSTTDMSYALERIHEWFPKASLWVHTVPLRGSFAGNPPESDPVWHGDEAECWKSHGGQFADGHFYQTDHGDYLYPPTTCSCAKWPEKFGHQNSDEACQFNRHEDSVARSGAGHNGWRVLPGGVCLFETVAFEWYRKNRDLQFPNSISSDAQKIAAMGVERVYVKWAATPSFGNGMP